MIFDNVRTLTPPSLLKPNTRRAGKQSNEPLLVWTMDDAFLSDYTTVYPLLSANGIKGTSFVATDWVGGKGFCSWEQLKEMKASGMWDLQGHTHTHPMLGLKDEARIRQEMETVNAEFIAQGLEPPEHHAYPFGSSSAISEPIVAEYRKTQRLTGAYRKHTNNREDIISSPYGVLKGVSIDTQDDDRLALVKDVITWGNNTGKVIILYHHRVVSEPDGYAYQISEHYLNEIVEHVKATGIRSVTLPEMYNIVYEQN